VYGATISNNLSPSSWTPSSSYGGTNTIFPINIVLSVSIPLFLIMVCCFIKQKYKKNWRLPFLTSRVPTAYGKCSSTVKPDGSKVKLPKDYAIEHLTPEETKTNIPHPPPDGSKVKLPKDYAIEHLTPEETKTNRQIPHPPAMPHPPFNPPPPLHSPPHQSASPTPLQPPLSQLPPRPSRQLSPMSSHQVHRRSSQLPPRPIRRFPPLPPKPSYVLTVVPGDIQETK